MGNNNNIIIVDMEKYAGDRYEYPKMKERIVRDVCVLRNKLIVGNKDARTLKRIGLWVEYDVLMKYGYAQLLKYRNRLLVHLRHEGKEVKIVA